MVPWFLNNADSIALRVYRDKSTRRFLSDVFDYLVTIDIEGYKFWGRGIDENENIALAAACAEVVEHATIQPYRFKNKNWGLGGIAAHSTFQEAKDRAIAELIERDAFFCHFLTKTPFTDIPTNYSIERIREKLALDGITLRVGKMHSLIGWESVVAACFGASATKPFGVFIGTSSRTTWEDALIKASKEAVALVSGHLRTNGVKSDIASDGPLFNHQVASQPLAEADFEIFFDRSTPTFEHPETGIETETLDIHPAFKDCPVTIVRATSPDAQQLFFGETKPEHINFKRLSQFLGKEVRWEDVNKTTHVFA